MCPTDNNTNKRKQQLRSVLVLAILRLAIGRVYTPKQPLTLTAWPLSSNGPVKKANIRGFAYPEAASRGDFALHSLLERPNLGIAFCGGGLRASSLGLGYLRALHLLNVSSQARYISSNSGGSWLSVPFSYQSKVPISTFLGHYIPPEQLTVARLRQQPPAGSFDGVIANAHFGAPAAVDAFGSFLDSLTGAQQRSIGSWSQAIGKSFLSPYGLNSDASTFTAAGTAGPVHQAAAALPAGVDVYTYKPTSIAADGTVEHRPFPIVLGSIVSQISKGNSRYHPFEFTPLYAGVPETVEGRRSIIGGGFVEPLGLNSLPDLKGTAMVQQQQQHRMRDNATGAADIGGAQPVLVRAQSNYLVPLKVVAGISSSVVANIMQTVQPEDAATRALFGTETLSFWSPATLRVQPMSFADGAGVDNTAVTPLLRRRVSKIVACFTAVKSVRDVTPRQWAGYNWDLAALFGMAPEDGGDVERLMATSSSAQEINRRTQVFPCRGFLEMFAALRSAAASGGPAHHLATYTVQANPYQGVDGGWKVHVLWIINQEHPTWESRLPANLAAKINAARTVSPVDVLPAAEAKSLGGQLLAGAASLTSDVFDAIAGPDGLPTRPISDALGLANFPYIPITNANYSPLLTQLMSQHATWQVLQLESQLQQLLSG